MHSEKITKVKFRDGGLGGMIVLFERPQKRSGENFREGHKVTYPAPCHKELLEHKDKLTAHIKDICRIHSDIGDEEISVTDISSNAYDQFVLRGTVRSYGDTECPLKTANIQDATGYSSFLDVIEIIGELYNEIRSYIRVDKKTDVDLVQLAMDFAVRDKKVDQDEVAGMDEEQKKSYYREYLESKNCIIIEMEAPEGNLVSDQERVMEEDAEMAEEGMSDVEGEIMSDDEREQSYLPEAAPPQQPGFGESVSETKVIPIDQPAKYPDDLDHVRDVRVPSKKSRSLG